MSVPAHLVVGMLWLYRTFLSPLKKVLFGDLGACRYDPSCSAYMIAAVKQYGAARGLWLGLGRLGRCHPWGGCGPDPVPKDAFPKKKMNHNYMTNSKGSFRLR